MIVSLGVDIFTQELGKRIDTINLVRVHKQPGEGQQEETNGKA